MVNADGSYCETWQDGPLSIIENIQSLKRKTARKMPMKKNELLWDLCRRRETACILCDIWPVVGIDHLTEILVKTID
jgi:hypothetical protein